MPAATTTDVQSDRLLPSARRLSRRLVLGGIAASLVARSAGPRGARAQDGIVLGALAVGMPHGAADAELLRRSTSGRARLVGSMTAYGGSAVAATALLRRGGRLAAAVGLAVPALHFTEAELACWPSPPSGRSGVPRVLAATATTVAIPRAVGLLGGAKGPSAAGRRGGLGLLAAVAPRDRVRLLLTCAATGCIAAGLARAGDREVALDLALLTAAPLLTPPPVSFALTFGAWHALRHTARVADSLAASGALPAGLSLGRAAVLLARRSAWASAVGAAGAAVVAVRSPTRSADDALSAVLGLTVPHLVTVAATLGRRRAA